jgi:formate/nitrite transporter FocA (FNT family)
MSSAKPFKIEDIVMSKVESLKRSFEKVRGMSMLNMVLIGLSVVSFVLFYLSVEDNVFEFVEILFNLDWYWYLITVVVLGIKPAIYLAKKIRR